MSYIGSTEIGKMYLGSTQIAEAYLGSTLVYRYATPVPTGYITDGLAFHIDGIECANGTVKDLISNTTFSANTPASIAYQNDGIVLSGGCLYVSRALLSNSSSQTVEVCFSPGTVAQASCIFTSGTNGANTYYPNVVISTSGQKLTFLARKGSAYNPGLVAGSKYTISMNTTRGISNGVVLATNGTDYYANQNNYTVIGARRYSNAFSGKFSGTIYSIRVYSRQLTQAEMLNNQRYDNYRFNLGLTI